MIKSIILLLLTLSVFNVHSQQRGDNWTHFVRIAGHGLNKSNIDATIKDVQQTHLFGFEVDNDVTGRYNSFLDPEEKLADIKLLAERAHAINNHAFVYIAGLECITDEADKKEHTFFKDHPDWVQRDINNRAAVFGGGDAFWITKGDEDVWISPYAPAWRNKYMELVRKIAATGIDGIYVDIPYWMTHFEGWENSWASFDDYTVAAFKSKTGIDAKKDVKLGDVSNANFRKWIDFRIETLTAFMADIDSNAKSVNTNCKTIAEIYPGIGEEAVRVGADVYDLYNVVDAIAHEFSGGHGNAASKNPGDWFERMVGMYTFRAFAGDKASWMLSYSWDKENKVKPVEPMKNLALSNLMAGTNNYDAARHVMSGSNDYPTRTLINKWTEQHQDIFYKPRTAIAPVGVYFSPKTRNYFPDAFMESFQGIMKMLLQAHVEFEIVTPRTLNKFTGKALVLPDVKCISSDEQNFFNQFLKDGKHIIATGETGIFDENGNDLKNSLDLSNNNIVFYRDCPGKQFSRYLKKEFDTAAWSGSFLKTTFYNLLEKFKTNMLKTAVADAAVEISASPFISSQIASVEGRPHVFLSNFGGLKGDAVVNQRPEKGITMKFIAPASSKVYYLPFLGEKQQLKTRRVSGRIVCTLPVVEKGGVVWLEK